MPKAVLVVFTRPGDPSREGEYNDWYDCTHLPQVCAIPGITSARRFKASVVQREALVGPLPDYLALYEIEADDLDATLTELRARGESGVNDSPPAGLLELDPGYEVGLYEF